MLFLSSIEITSVAYVVLLAQGELSVLFCQREDVFLAAKMRNAGICRVFEEKTEAEDFIVQLLQEQKRNGWQELDT